MNVKNTRPFLPRNCYNFFTISHYLLSHSFFSEMFPNVNNCFIYFCRNYECKFDVKSGRSMLGHVVTSADTTLMNKMFNTMISRGAPPGISTRRRYKSRNLVRSKRQDTRINWVIVHNRSELGATHGDHNTHSSCITESKCFMNQN